MSTHKDPLIERNRRELLVAIGEPEFHLQMKNSLAFKLFVRFALDDCEIDPAEIMKHVGGLSAEVIRQAASGDVTLPQYFRVNLFNPGVVGALLSPDEVEKRTRRARAHEAAVGLLSDMNSTDRQTLEDFEKSLRDDTVFTEVMRTVIEDAGVTAASIATRTQGLRVQFKPTSDDVRAWTTDASSFPVMLRTRFSREVLVPLLKEVLA